MNVSIYLKLESLQSLFSPTSASDLRFYVCDGSDPTLIQSLTFSR